MDVSKNGGKTQEPWGVPTKNDQFAVFWGGTPISETPIYICTVCIKDVFL